MKNIQVILNGCCTKLNSALEKRRSTKFRTWKAVHRAKAGIQAHEVLFFKP